jgi:hypothetical protein
LAQWDYIVE